MKHRQTMFLPGVTWSDRLTRWHHTRCIMGCGTVTERPLTTEVSWWPLTHRAADGPLDSSHSYVPDCHSTLFISCRPEIEKDPSKWLWSISLYHIKGKWGGFWYLQLDYSEFQLVVYPSRQKIPLMMSYLLYETPGEEQRLENIHKNHGGTDKVYVNGTCRVIIL